MVRSDTATVQILSVGPEEVRFEVSYDGDPVEGATVGISQMITVPTLVTKTTDENGAVIFDVRGLYPPEILNPCVFLESAPWLVMAFVDNSPFAWYGEVDLHCGDVYKVALQKHVEVPTFYLDFHLRNIIGRDLFGSLITQLQVFLLNWQGFTDVEVAGEGTDKIRVSFKPPVAAQGITGAELAAAAGTAIHWLALHPYIVALIILIVGILAILIVSKIVFGKETAAIAKGTLIVAGLFATGTIITALTVSKRKKSRRD